jgi:hypothetical protein
MLTKVSCHRAKFQTRPTDTSSASYPIYTKSLAQVFVKLPNLTDLCVAFNMAPAGFFKALSKAIPKMRLEHLKLKHLITRYRYLALFLDGVLPTLYTLTLDCIDLTRSDDEQALFSFLHAVSFQRTVIRGLNVDDEGIQFSAANEWICRNYEKVMESTLSGFRKQYELIVDEHEVDNVSYCHDHIAGMCQRRPTPWPRDLNK